MMKNTSRPAPTSAKTLKFVPDFYDCSCGLSIDVRNYLRHLEQDHGIKLHKRICVHGPIYNDATAWKRTGDNCRDHKLLVIMDDGRFPGFKKINGSDNSTDGSKELILSYPNTMYFAHGEDYEEAKFNFAMHLAAKMGFEYVILLGSDEWIVGDIGKLVNELDKRMIKLPAWESQAFHCAIDEHQAQNKWNRFITESPKIYYGPGLLRTRFTHWLRYSSTQIARTQKDDPLAVFQKRLLGEKTIVIHHDDSIRGKERNQLMTKFQDGNVERERQRIMREAFANQFQVSFFMTPRRLSNWHKSFILQSKVIPYSHYLIFDEGVKVNKKTIERFHRALYTHNEIDVLSAVYKLDEKKNWTLTINPPDVRYATEKLYEIYHKAKFSKKNKLFAVTIELGPIIAIKKSILNEFEDLVDKKQFLLKCQELGYRVFADSEIQIKPIQVEKK